MVNQCQRTVLFLTPEAFIERKVYSRTISAGQAKAAAAADGAFHREMIYSVPNLLFRPRVHGDQGSQKRVMGLFNRHLQRLIVQ
jgi:hypothetical protein